MFNLAKKSWQNIRRAFGASCEDYDPFGADDEAPINSYAGERVTTSTAQRLTAVWACKRVLAETVASLPLFVYVHNKSKRRKERATDHPLYFLLHDEPNPEMDSFRFRELTMNWLCGHGNAYHFIETNKAGYPIGLWPLYPTRVIVRRDHRRVNYEIVSEDGRETYPSSRIWHPMGLSDDGLTGLSPIQECRQAIGLGLGAEQYGSRLFANDSRTTGVIEVGMKLGKNEEEAKSIKRKMQEDWQASRGANGRHKVAIMDHGATFKSISINPDDAQFLETRKFQVSEICRIFRVPPHMVADLEKATFSNIEHQAIEFVTHTIRPWLVRLEQSMKRVLLTREEKENFFIEFNVEGLLRGDTQARYRSYAIARQWGWLSVNDIRDLENLNPIEGGDIYLQPLNMVPSGTDSAQDERGADGDSDTPPAASRIIHSYSGFCGVMGNLLRQEQNGHGHQ